MVSVLQSGVMQFDVVQYITYTFSAVHKIEVKFIVMYCSADDRSAVQYRKIGRGSIVILSPLRRD